jgi:hypothetical protein
VNFQETEMKSIKALMTLALIFGSSAAFADAGGIETADCTLEVNGQVVQSKSVSVESMGASVALFTYSGAQISLARVGTKPVGGGYDHGGNPAAIVFEAHVRGLSGGRLPFREKAMLDYVGYGDGVTTMTKAWADANGQPVELRATCKNAIYE